mmetsp:Transcript_3152/g.6732  ORF Transcript_3152/g.6732 Transcript_3152/m.6732 type:complete len:96 (+) Transcript_3152:643-930(+)
MYGITLNKLWFPPKFVINAIALIIHWISAAVCFFLMIKTEGQNTRDGTQREDSAKGKVRRTPVKLHVPSQQQFYLRPQGSGLDFFHALPSGASTK